jgi:hypothetical protein
MWMVDAREEVACQRHSELLALIVNRTRWSDKEPTAMPADFNPRIKKKPARAQPADMTASMDRFFAANPNMPVRHMRLVDGQWVEVTGEADAK